MHIVPILVTIFRNFIDIWKETFISLAISLQSVLLNYYDWTCYVYGFFFMLPLLSTFVFNKRTTKKYYRVFSCVRRFGLIVLSLEMISILLCNILTWYIGCGTDIIIYLTHTHTLPNLFFAFAFEQSDLLHKIIRRERIIDRRKIFFACHILLLLEALTPHVNTISHSCLLSFKFLLVHYFCTVLRNLNNFPSNKNQRYPKYIEVILLLVFLFEHIFTFMFTNYANNIVVPVAVACIIICDLMNKIK